MRFVCTCEFFRQQQHRAAVALIHEEQLQILDAVQQLDLPAIQGDGLPGEDLDLETVNNETAKLALKHLYNVVTEQLRIDIHDLFIAELITDTQYQQLPSLQLSHKDCLLRQTNI